MSLSLVGSTSLKSTHEHDVKVVTILQINLYLYLLSLGGVLVLVCSTLDDI